MLGREKDAGGLGDEVVPWVRLEHGLTCLYGESKMLEMDKMPCDSQVSQRSVVYAKRNDVCAQRKT